MEIRTSAQFEDAIEHLSKHDRARLSEIVKRIVENPSIGKPLRYGHRRERVMRIGQKRLTYAHHAETLFLLTLENRDHVYRRRKR
jgi:mRNA-degrading endonuclease RelE of RelBE toxin-antitoxin system